MKSTIIKLSLLLGLTILIFNAWGQNQKEKETIQRFAQEEFRTWSVGLHGGVTNQNTVFNDFYKEFETAKEALGLGIYVKKQIFPSFGMQAEFFTGTVSGLRQNNGIPNDEGNFVFVPNTSYTTQAQWAGAITAVQNIANIGINKNEQVVIPYIKAGLGYMSSNAKLTNAAGVTNEAGSRQDWYIPTGVGVKIGISKNINLDFGYDANLIRTNVFNGIKGNSYDKFAYAHGGIEIVLGKKDKPQLQNHSALANLKQQTMEESEELRTMLSTVEQNAKRDKQKYAKELGDDDHDGVANKFDKCPDTEPGTVVDGSGCPIKLPAETETNHKVNDDYKKIIGEAIDVLDFEFNKAVINISSYPYLDKVAALLIEKNLSLKLSGHTDNSGPRWLNIRLSKNRALAVKTYLISKGVNPNRIEAVGYGPDKPIVSNDTFEGRKKNRRVEFNTY